MLTSTCCGVRHSSIAMLNLFPSGELSSGSNSVCSSKLSLKSLGMGFNVGEFVVGFSCLSSTLQDETECVPFRGRLSIESSSILSVLDDVLACEPVLAQFELEVTVGCILLAQVGGVIRLISTCGIL